MKLTRSERWILANQFKILAKLSPNEAESYEKALIIIERGYVEQYEWLAERIVETEMSEMKCKDVLNILDMFDALRVGYETLADKTDVDEAWIKFPGFDENSEGDYYNYASFLIERQNMYRDLHQGDHYNSHTPVLPNYRKMLAEWQKSTDQHRLTRADLIRITGAVIE